MPDAKRAVLVGTMIGPGEVHIKDDGTEVRTLWGELAWQLGGPEAYATVADSDKHGTNPGDRLVELLRAHAPCLILIDEWVAYARQLYGVDGLPAGSFDAQFTFAQALEEAAKRVPGALVVVAIPASDIEVGGEAGLAALERFGMSSSVPNHRGGRRAPRRDSRSSAVDYSSRSTRRARGNAMPS